MIRLKIYFNPFKEDGRQRLAQAQNRIYDKILEDFEWVVSTSTINERIGLAKLSYSELKTGVKICEDYYYSQFESIILKQLISCDYGEKIDWRAIFNYIGVEARTPKGFLAKVKRGKIPMTKLFELLELLRDEYAEREEVSHA